MKAARSPRGAQLDVTRGRFDIGSARQHRAGTRWLWRHSIFDTDTGSPLTVIELLFASERQIADVIFVKS